MDKKVLYLGDTALTEAAGYLAGVMSYYGIGFDYVDSGRKFDSKFLENRYCCFIISDYPGKNFTKDQLSKLAGVINEGAGLLMIGGWESFSGANGEYNDTVLREVLPVEMENGDDRVNCYQPCLIEKICEHEILGSLPFERQVTQVGGFNRFKSKELGKTILNSRRFKVCKSSIVFEFEKSEANPLLVVGSYGKGRVCAFASDVAPHWVGGLVDWGEIRVAAKAEGANDIEVGGWYAKFFSNMVKWAAGEKIE